MLDIKHIVTNDITNPKGRMERFLHMKRMMDAKSAANLRLLATKNNINRASDYHYLNLAVTQSTEPVNGIDYIHPVVKSNIDYVAAVVAKGLSQNGEINFEFVADNEEDEQAARQATEIVHKVINQHNDPHKILQHWILDALLHKNGEMLIQPHREQITRYVKTKGTSDQLKAFEAQAADAGLTATRTSKRKVSVDIPQVIKETKAYVQANNDAHHQTMIEQHIERLKGAQQTQDYSELDEPLGDQAGLEQSHDDALTDSVTRNTIHEAEYKLVGYNLNVRFRPISQHYWMCNPTIVNIQDQDFCGFFSPMSIQEAAERYPDLDLEKFAVHAEFSNVGAYQAGSLLNNLAIHARDSVPINGLPATGYATQDANARQVMVLTTWNRYDIDGDGELELIEIVYSGSYVISAKEVEFIPVANMCPRPLPQNFYGYSVAESLVPAQEYMTAGHRSEIQLGLLTATPRLGVKPDRVDFEELADGEAAIFILDSKFDPATDVYPVPAPSGNPAFIDVAMNRIQQDVMALIGMTTPQDTFNPEVMDPGNSGAKLQLAMGPNQVIQDNTVKNCAEGVKEAIWLVWRTLIQYGDDYGVKKLAQLYHEEKKPIFLDAQAFDDMNFSERAQIHIELALGMKSEENAIQRQQIIVQTQQQLYATTQQMVAANTLTPQMWQKIKKPYADTLYVLGIKDCDTYLPTDQEVMAMIKQAQEAAKNAPPTKDQASAQLDVARTQEIQSKINGQSPDAQAQLAKANETNANTQGTSAGKQLDAIALLKEHKGTNY